MIAVCLGKLERVMISIERRNISIASDVEFVEHLVSVADLLQKNLGHVQFSFDTFRKEFNKKLSNGDIVALMDSLGIPIDQQMTRTKTWYVIKYSELRKWLEARKGDTNAPN